MEHSIRIQNMKFVACRSKIKIIFATSQLKTGYPNLLKCPYIFYPAFSWDVAYKRIVFWFRRLACSTCGKQSWPLFSPTFFLSSFLQRLLLFTHFGKLPKLKFCFLMQLPSGTDLENNIILTFEASTNYD